MYAAFPTPLGSHYRLPFTFALLAVISKPRFIESLLGSVCKSLFPFSFLLCFLAVLREEAIKRIVERDGKTRAEAEKRIDSQITNSQRAQARQENNSM
jgi:hypothetical protein